MISDLLQVVNISILPNGFSFSGVGSSHFSQVICINENKCVKREIKRKHKKIMAYLNIKLISGFKLFLFSHVIFYVCYHVPEKESQQKMFICVF